MGKPLHGIPNCVRPLTITEVGGTRHEIKGVSRIAADYRGNDQFTLRVEYRTGDPSALESILFGLIDGAEVQRIKQIFEGALEDEDKIDESKEESDMALARAFREATDE